LWLCVVPVGVQELTSERPLSLDVIDREAVIEDKRGSVDRFLHPLQDEGSKKGALTSEEETELRHKSTKVGRCCRHSAGVSVGTSRLLCVFVLVQFNRCLGLAVTQSMCVLLIW